MQCLKLFALILVFLAVDSPSFAADALGVTGSKRAVYRQGVFGRVVARGRDWPPDYVVAGRVESIGIVAPLVAELAGDALSQYLGNRDLQTTRDLDKTLDELEGRISKKLEDLDTRLAQVEKSVKQIEANDPVTQVSDRIREYQRSMQLTAKGMEATRLAALNSNDKRSEVERALTEYPELFGSRAQEVRKALAKDADDIEKLIKALTDNPVRKRNESRGEPRSLGAADEASRSLGQLIDELVK